MLGDLEKFYEAVMAEEATEIKKVYTQSKRSKIALQVMNECALENADWANTIQMLSVYPVQIWAREMRGVLALSLENINTALNTGDTYLGFDSRKVLKQQQNILLITDEAMDLLHDAIIDNSGELPKDEINTLRALHTIDGEEVSNYIFHKYYKVALEHLCEYIAEDINTLFEPVKKELNTMEDDLKIVYHSAYLLLQMGKTLSKESARRSSVADYVALYDQLRQCIYGLKTYPFGGEELYLVANMAFSGYREVRIAKELGKSRTYVRSRMKEASNILGILIWGYATPVIIGFDSEI